MLKTHKVKNLDAAGSFLDKAVGKMDELESSCRARGTASRDALFIELADTLNSLGTYLINMHSAIHLNTMVEEEE